MRFSIQSITMNNFKGIVNEKLDFTQYVPGLYFVAGENKIEPSLQSNGAGKALYDNLEIDTPNGKIIWKNIKVGDYLFGNDGNYVRVTHVFPQGIKRLYKVLFDDLSETIVSEDHLWNVSSVEYGYNKIISTRDIRRCGIKYNNGTKYGARSWYLPEYKPVEFISKAVPIDPYILGMWIGNGTVNTSNITVNSLDTDIIDRLSNYSLSESDSCNSNSRIKVYDYGNSVCIYIPQLKTFLKKLNLSNLNSHKRFIPNEYLYNSIDVRLELLKGLLDSDGYVDKKGRCYFSSTSKMLIEQVRWLGRSLGGKVSSISSKIGNYITSYGERIYCKESFRIMLTFDTYVFFCKRKKERQNINVQKRYLTRWIDAIEFFGEGECTCVKVDSDDGLFLANDFIVTHNSTLLSDSLSWVFSGKTARSNRPSSDIENWYSGNKTTSVICEFLLGNELYTIERSRKPNRLTINGEIVEQDAIDNLLPISEAAFRRTILIDQFAQLFLSLSPEAKSRIFSDTLSLNKLLSASDKAGSDLKLIQSTMDRLERDIDSTTSVMSEVSDQFTRAVEKEKEFEQARNNRKEQVIIKLNEAKNTLAESLYKLDNTRSQWNGLESETDNKVKSNNLRVEQTKITKQITVAEVNSENIAKQLVLLKKQISDDLLICPECKQTLPVVQVQRIQQERNLKKLMLEQEYKQQLELIARLKDEQTALTTEISELENSLQEFNKVQAEISLWAERSLSDQKIVNNLRHNLKDIEEQINPFREQADKLAQRYEELKSNRSKNRKRLKKLNEESEILKFWQKGFREIRLEQIDLVLLELEIVVNRQAELLGLIDWDIKFSTEKETASGSISHKFSVSLYPPNMKEPVSWESYSGGESQRWQLATTFALSEILLSRAGIFPDIEILDEATTHLSQQGIDDLLTCLSDRAKELNRRIFLIDHNSLDRGSFDGIINVVKDNSGVHIL